MNKKDGKKKKRTIENDLFMVRLAEQAERYPDMFAYLSTVMKNRKNPAHFTNDERNLISHTFKNLITPRRQAWRLLVSQKQSTGSIQTAIT